MKKLYLSLFIATSATVSSASAAEEFLCVTQKASGYIEAKDSLPTPLHFNQSFRIASKKEGGGTWHHLRAEGQKKTPALNSLIASEITHTLTVIGRDRYYACTSDDFEIFCALGPGMHFNYFRKTNTYGFSNFGPISGNGVHSWIEFGSCSKLD